MNKIKLLLVFSFALLMSSCSGQTTADKVIEKYIRAIGGRKAIESIETISITKELTRKESGTKSTSYSYHKRPNKRHFGSFDSNSFMATDGNKAWIASMNISAGRVEWNELPDDRALTYIRNADFYRFIGPFIDYDKKNMTVEYIGLEEVDRQKLEHLRLSWPDELVWDLYFMKKGGLLYMYKTDETTFVKVEDYRKVNKILVAHRTITIGKNDNTSFNHVNQITDIQINIALDDNMFMPPRK